MNSFCNTVFVIVMQIKLFVVVVVVVVVGVVDKCLKTKTRMIMLNTLVLALFQFTGLVDAETGDEFLTQLECFKDVWNTIEKEHLLHSQSSKFHDYISNKVTLVNPQT